MKTFDYKRYTFYCYDNVVCAKTTYAGKIVKGYAKCDPTDKFDLEAGKKLASARCALKVAEKRAKRANRKFLEAKELDAMVFSHLMDMGEYKQSADLALIRAQKELEEITAKM